MHLKAYGFIIFRIVSKDVDIRALGDRLEMDEAKREAVRGYSWKIEEYHRGIKQFCGVENCQATNQSQRAHIMFLVKSISEIRSRKT